jgi:myosin heavy subunit
LFQESFAKDKLVLELRQQLSTLTNSNARERAALEEQLQESSSQVEVLMEELSSKQSGGTEKDSEIALLLTELEDCQQTNSDLKLTLESIQKTYKEVQSENMVLKDAYKELEGSSQQLQEKLEQTQSKSKALEKTVVELEESKKELEAFTESVYSKTVGAEDSQGQSGKQLATDHMYSLWINCKNRLFNSFACFVHCCVVVLLLAAFRFDKITVSKSCTTILDTLGKNTMERTQLLGVCLDSLRPALSRTLEVLTCSMSKRAKENAILTGGHSDRVIMLSEVTNL